MFSTYGAKFFYFNPRSHERSDEPVKVRVVFPCDFNPRSHERSDGFRGSQGDCKPLISIHAPTRGATVLKVLFFAPLQFQSTLPREERRLPSEPLKPLYEFQSTLPREERPLYCPTAPHPHNFNPRSHERSDGRSSHKIVLLKYFNPRSHERSDK